MELEFFLVGSGEIYDDDRGFDERYDNDNDNDDMDGVGADDSGDDHYYDGYNVNITDAHASPRAAKPKPLD